MSDQMYNGQGASPITSTNTQTPSLQTDPPLLVGCVPNSISPGTYIANFTGTYSKPADLLCAIAVTDDALLKKMDSVCCKGPIKTDSSGCYHWCRNARRRSSVLSRSVPRPWRPAGRRAVPAEAIRNAAVPASRPAAKPTVAV